MNATKKQIPVSEQHHQWTEIGNGYEPGTMFAAIEPLSWMDLGNDEYGAMAHPDAGSDWRAVLVRYGAHAGGSRWHAVVRFPAIRQHGLTIDQLP